MILYNNLVCVDQGIAYIPSEQLDTWTGLDILICQKKKKNSLHYIMIT